MFIFKNHLITLFFLFIILIGCKLQEPLKTHGIIYLENRSNKLTVNQSNKNDVINIIGRPQISDSQSENSWIYVERTLSKGKYHKLGRHVIKDNNVLILSFDKYGILKEKQFLTKEDINNIDFVKKETSNEISQQSFVTKFLQSVREKMYNSRK
tara:strand:- start:399 stop:860 length:462 start_codon:yes stop_codon:yes gene_type:complete